MTIPIPAVADRRRRDERRHDRWATLALVGVVLVFAAPMVWGGVRLGQDTATQFYPWYANLGERLRAGDVPEWNPHQFAGAPLAADPQSGWMYLPAMLFFTALPLAAAVVAQIVGHLALAAFGMYGLARRVGLGRIGALVAGTALAGSGVLLGRIPSGPASYEALAWLPWVLLGAELALRAARWPGRLAGWTLCGLAVSQALVAWVGQVSYYTLLLLAAWIAFRVLWGEPRGARAGAATLRSAILVPALPLTITPRPLPRPRWDTLGRLLVHGLAMLVMGLGLSAAGVLPRLEFNAVSSASGGEYGSTVGAVIGGSSGDDVIDRLFQPSVYYPGASVLALAVIGIVVGRGRYGIPFWGVVAVVVIVLTIPRQTPLHRLFYLLPEFRTLHEHWPERIVIVAFPGLAILAGAGAQAVVDGSRLAGRFVLRWAALVVPALVLGGFSLVGQVSWIAFGGIAGVLLVVGLRLVGPPDWRVLLHRPRDPEPHPSDWLPALLVVIVAADLLLMTQALAGQAPFGGFHRRDIDAYYAPSGAAAFLRDRAGAGESFRYAGFDPSLRVTENGVPVLYRYQFADDATRGLAVNNRATLLGLADIQGYDPLQIQRYVDLVSAMNGGPQEYHGADLYPAGTTSPILDLLGVRYLIVPSAIPADQAADFAGLATWPTVYDDGRERVIENPDPVAPAWLVGQVVTVDDGQAAALIASGQVDPMNVGVYEEGDGPAPPALPVATSPIRGRVTASAGDDPDRLDYTVTTDRPALVVLSEVAYPAWVAEVDGDPVDVLTVDRGLRAVAVPAGEHTVTLRYDSPATRIGLVVSALTLITLLTGWVAMTLADRRTDRPLARSARNA